MIGTRQLSLFYLNAGRRYALKFSGENESEFFPTITDAIERGQMLVVSETWMTLYNADGVPMVTTTIRPVDE